MKKHLFTLSFSSLLLCAEQNLNPYTEHRTSTVIGDFVLSAKPSSQVSSITSPITFKKLYHPGMEQPEAYKSDCFYCFAVLVTLQHFFSNTFRAPSKQHFLGTNRQMDLARLSGVNQ